MSLAEIAFVALVAVPSALAGVVTWLALRRVETDLSAFEAFEN